MGTQGVDDLIPLVTSASVCDAMARRHAHVCHVVGLRSARDGQVSYGPAATVRFAPRRDDLPDHDLAAAAGHALSAVPPGAVLVIAGPDAPGEAVAGGKKLAAVEELGARAVVAWGAIRDRAEAAEYRMGVWALGETPRASGDLLQVVERALRRTQQRARQIYQLRKRLAVERESALGHVSPRAQAATCCRWLSRAESSRSGGSPSPRATGCSSMAPGWSWCRSMSTSTCWKRPWRSRGQTPRR